jgi:hypothetical protein
LLVIVASEAQPPQAVSASATCSAPSASGQGTKVADSSSHSAPVKRSAADIKRASHLAYMAYNLMEVAQFLLKAADAAPAVAQQAESEASPKDERAQARNEKLSHDGSAERKNGIKNNNS